MEASTAHLLAASISATTCDLSRPQFFPPLPASSWSFFWTGSSLEVAAPAPLAEAAEDLDLQPVSMQAAIRNKGRALRMSSFYAIKRRANVILEEFGALGGTCAGGCKL